MARFDDAFRLALWEAWNFRCAWCGNPLDLHDLEVEHIIAAGLEGDERKAELARHGLMEDYDVDSTENLVPAHGRPCNRRKAMKPLPDSPVIANFRQDAQNRAAEIEKVAAKRRQGHGLTKALAVVTAADPDALTAKQRDALVNATSAIAARLGLPPSVRVHSAVDPHDYVPPDVIEAGKIFGTERFRELLNEWSEFNDLDEVVAYGFDADGQRLESASAREVQRIGYVDELDMYLVRARFSVSYTHYDDEGIGGPADADVIIDLWAELDDDRREILELDVDYNDTLPEPSPDSPEFGRLETLQ